MQIYPLNNCFELRKLTSAVISLITCLISKIGSETHYIFECQFLSTLRVVFISESKLSIPVNIACTQLFNTTNKTEL